MAVELMSVFGNDDMVVNAARVSFNKTADQYTEEQNERLIKFLAEHGHTAPFRHPHLQFRITCPIYVERQLFKHQVGWTANSISGRYVDFSDSYTKINTWRRQSTSSKQGSEGVIGDPGAASVIEHQAIEFSASAYRQLLNLGVAKEQARTILPLCLNTQFVWTGSLQAFFHLCDLRLKPDAQAETKEVVQEMLTAVKSWPGNPFCYSLEAFGY